MNSLRQKTERYSPLSIALHWITFILFIGIYASIELKGYIPKGDPWRDMLKEWHFILGLTVFCLVWVRLALRITTQAPRILPSPPAWQVLLSKLTHLALYLMMIAMPLAGWLLLSSAGKPIPFWGLSLPQLISKNPDLASQIKYWHELIGNAAYWLIGMHAAAVLYHHYFVRDNTLSRMV